MKIKFCVHSQTGNSLSVSNTLMTQMKDTDNTFELIQITPSDEQQMDPNKITISPIPDGIGADLIVFGGPVHAFSASVTLLKAISMMENIKGKTCIIYVTQFFPFDWMGGNRALRQLEQALNEKGANVIYKKSVHWKSKNRSKQIDALVSRLKCN